jgi:ribonuclease P/MRP protein subunit POP1
MAKAGSSKPPAQSGTSRGTEKAFKGKGKPDKVIQKTIDLLKANEKRKSSGKGKEKAVLGDVASGIERKSCRLGDKGACLSGRAQIYAGWYPSGKICGGTFITFVLSRSKLTGQARALEIFALQNAIKSAAYVGPIVCFHNPDADKDSALGSTRAFQSLPRHLRRRAASHNPRRVPKRYRSRAAAEVSLSVRRPHTIVLFIIADSPDPARGQRSQAPP